ncbi:alpha/beta fold hydrolase [Gordonia phosphorivorans]|uniref:Alpha/beta fold hydrolase n=1 Tax=Gordonia phosphorivorans TaxID=1056982 RepID=A0ABV6H9Q2_9ACTN
MSLHSSRSRMVAALAATALLAAGCTAGPAPGPKVVHGEGGDAAADTAANTLPPLSAPKRDLNYTSCGSRLADKYDVDAPEGVQLDCAFYQVPIDPDHPDSNPLIVTVVRAQSSQTPKDAAPLVLTTGADLPSSRLALSLDSATLAPLLAKHPLVAVDHRGLGQSAPVDCLTSEQRSTLANDGAAGTRDVAARTTVLAQAAREGADICNDTLEPDQLKYAATFAAADIEQLRSRWQVDRIGLVGIGSGSSVALAYQAKHPGNVGRLILDSPVGLNVQAGPAAAATAAGVQNSLATFAQRCANVGCSLGSDGLGTLKRVISAGATGALRGLSDTSILTAITTTLALGPTDPDGLKKLADALTAADRGDADDLRALVENTEPVRNADGQQVTRCNDMVGRPGLDDIPGLARTWGTDAPMTANTAALSLARCDGWGSAGAAPAPTSFPIAPLVLLGLNDPINGLKAAEALTPLLVTTGADARTVSWDGLGYSVLARSRCAAEIVVGYLGEDKLTGPAERACPA